MKRQVKIKVQVPEWVNWIAQDKDGSWWAYAAKPSEVDAFNWWASPPETRNRRMIIAIGPTKDWRKSLKRIK